MPADGHNAGLPAPPAAPEDWDDFDREFKPRGTVAVVAAFTAALILLWLAVYLILVARGVTV